MSQLTATPFLTAMILFTTEPTDRALAGWYPYETKTYACMSTEQVAQALRNRVLWA
jgi:hypothetical protein